MFRSTIIITFFSVLGIIINLITQLVIAYYFGANSARDAYFAAVTIPTYLTVLFSGSVVVLFLPALIRIQTNKGKEEGDLFASRFINLSAIAMLSIVFFGWIFAQRLLEITLPGFDGSRVTQAVPLFRILLLWSFFTSMMYLLSAVLQSRLNFGWAGFSSVIIAFFSLTGVVVLEKLIGIASMAVGSLLGSVLAVGTLWFVSSRDFAYSFDFRFREASLQKVLVSIFPLLLGGVFFRSISIIEKFVSSNYPEGVVSYLGYASLVITTLTTVISGGIGTSIFPALSKSEAVGETENLKRLLEKGVRLILFLTIPLVTLLYYFNAELIALIFQRGEFVAKDSFAVGALVFLYTGSLVGNSLGSVIMKLFYVFSKTKLIIALEIVALMLYAVPAFIVGRYFPYEGLAVTSSVVSLLYVSISLYVIARLLKGFRIGYILKGLASTLVVSLGCFGLASIVYDQLPASNGWMKHVTFLLSTGTSTLLYLCVMTYVLKVDEFDALRQKIYQFLR